MLDLNNTINIEKALNSLTVDRKAEFGKFGPQHMLEHLIVGLRMSNGKEKFFQHTPDDKLPLYHKFLMSEKEMPIGTKVPFMGEEPPALTIESLEEAKRVLLNEIEDFHKYYESNPEAIEMHPVFGNLNHSEWLRLHGKHFLHHFKQFGLVKAP